MIFKKDHFAFGAMMGSLIPVLVYLAFEQFNEVSRGGEKIPLFNENTVRVLSIFMNIIPFRFYMVKWQFDKTGRGILFVTFIYAFLFAFDYFRQSA
jgi:hypothetical protein